MSEAAKRPYEAIDYDTPFEKYANEEEGKSFIPFPVNGVLTIELVVSIGDCVSQNPLKWQVHRVKNQFPKMTNEQIAQVFNIHERTVRRLLSPFTFDIKDRFGMIIKREIIGGDER